MFAVVRIRLSMRMFAQGLACKSLQKTFVNFCLQKTYTRWASSIAAHMAVIFASYSKDCNRSVNVCKDHSYVGFTKIWVLVCEFTLVKGIQTLENAIHTSVKLIYILVLVVNNLVTKVDQMLYFDWKKIWSDLWIITVMWAGLYNPS